MDTAKLRILAGVSGALLGFAGIIALAISAGFFLNQWLSPWASCLIVGGVLMLFALTGMMIFLAPGKSSEEELEQLEDVTADLLADLPFDTIAAIVEKRPLAAISVAALMGYSVTKDPGSAAKNAERMLMGLF